MVRTWMTSRHSDSGLKIKGGKKTLLELTEEVLAITFTPLTLEK